MIALLSIWSFLHFLGSVTFRVFLQVERNAFLKKFLAPHRSNVDAKKLDIQVEEGM